MLVQLLLLGSVIHSGIKTYKNFSNPPAESELDESSLSPEPEQTQATDLRHQQMAQMSVSSKQNEIAEIDKENNRYLSILALGVGLTLAGTFFQLPIKRDVTKEEIKLYLRDR